MRFILPVIACSAFVSGLAAAPPEVAVVHPIQREITDSADFVGRTEASASVQIRSQVTGLLEKVLFKEGSEVKRGDVLFQLDGRIQKAEYEKAEAQVAMAQAMLKQTEADYQRIQRLEKINGAAKEEVDKAVAGLETAKASLLGARAGLDLAKINLERTRIVSPIAGRIGQSFVTEGNFVKADGDTLLATVLALDTLHVSFEVDERALLRLMRFNRERKDSVVKVAVGIPALDEKTLPRQATLDFIDNSLDPKTGTIHLRAVLPNPKGEMLPGMFVNVRIPLGEPRKALLLPSSALTPRGVLVVNEKNRIEDRLVARKRIDDEYVIDEGLTLEDWVVLDVRGLKVGDEVKPVPMKEIPTPAKRKDGGALPQRQRPLPELPGTGPALIVTAVYPGANSQTVEEVVAGPIDQQVNGIEGATKRFITCTDEGEMRLTVSFKKGTDLNQALVLLQNRVALAEPTLPDLVRRLGISIKKRPVHLCAVAVSSPDERHNREFLCGYAEKQIRDEMQRVAGVAECQFYGDGLPERQLRISADRAKLAALNLTTLELIEALRQQNLSVDGDWDNKFDKKILLAISGRVPEADQLSDIVIKARDRGQLVRLRDVAAIEVASGFNTTTKLDGKPCVVLTISRIVDADPAETMKRVEARLAELVKRLPAGMACRLTGQE